LGLQSSTAHVAAAAAMRQAVEMGRSGGRT
jgi:hypothetical protein